MICASEYYLCSFHNLTWLWKTLPFLPLTPLSNEVCLRSKWLSNVTILLPFHDWIKSLKKIYIKIVLIPHMVKNTLPLIPMELFQYVGHIQWIHWRRREGIRTPLWSFPPNNWWGKPTQVTQHSQYPGPYLEEYTLTRQLDNDKQQNRREGGERGCKQWKW